MFVFTRKLSTNEISKIIYKDPCFYLKGNKIVDFELTGTIIQVEERFIKFCDFFGEISIFKSRKTQVLKGPANLIIRPFFRKDSVAYFLASFKIADIYEELCSMIEMLSLYEAEYYINSNKY